MDEHGARPTLPSDAWRVYDKPPQDPSQALEEAEKARLRAEAEMAARAMLPSAPPRDFA